MDATQNYSAEGWGTQRRGFCENLFEHDKHHSAHLLNCKRRDIHLKIRTVAQCCGMQSRGSCHHDTRSLNLISWLYSCLCIMIAMFVIN